MPDFLDFFSGVSDQDNFDLAALKYFEELERQKTGRIPGSKPRPVSEEPEPTLDPQDEKLLAELDDGSLDSVTLRLMADTEAETKKPSPPPRTAPAERLGRPVLRGKEPPLSELARKAAALFDTLPTEDQLLAYTILQKLAKAAEGGA